MMMIPTISTTKRVSKLEDEELPVIVESNTDITAN